MKVPLYCFTTAYPSKEASDWTFVHPQVRYLQQTFEPIVFFPYYQQGEWDLTLKDVRVDQSMMALRRSRFFNPAIWLGSSMDIICNCSFAEFIKDWRRSLVDGMTARAVSRWVRNFVVRHPEPSVFYTTSLSSITLGLCRGLAGESDKRVVSRCIGGDVREDQHKSEHIPFKREVVNLVDWLFPVSQYLKNHLIHQFPDVAEKITVNNNGVSEVSNMVSSSRDGIYRIMSCGTMVPVKRVDLLARGLVKLARMKPNKQFKWRHMLLGSMDPEVDRIVNTEAPKNLEALFVTGVKDVRSYYQEHPIDLMVHVSRSEGYCVAVAEALSCGIPVLAADCGGMEDMVDNDLGRLVPVDVSPPELANHLWDLLQDCDGLQAMKTAARLRWQQVARADTNYSKFAKSMASIIPEEAQQRP